MNEAAVKKCYVSIKHLMLSMNTHFYALFPGDEFKFREFNI
jgi:hypothetical protein